MVEWLPSLLTLDVESRLTSLPSVTFEIDWTNEFRLLLTALLLGSTM